MFKEITEFVKYLYPNHVKIQLHVPVFNGNEKKYLMDCIDSTFVSSVGQYVNRFEEMICEYTKAKFAVATMNGTSALHISLLLVGVKTETEVLTQALTFVATANAISYTGAKPVFIDSSATNLGMCPLSLKSYLDEFAEIRENYSINRVTGKRFSACVPMHVFGHPVEIEAIQKVCKEYKIPIVEDAAESLGSLHGDEHTGLRGDVGIISLNGNKIVTSGGGGVIITNNEELAIRAKHLTTTAKTPHLWNFYHDEIGYNYRLPNINAALACAQMESLAEFVANKRKTAEEYRNFFKEKKIDFIDESPDARSNFWLNAILLEDKVERDNFLEYTNKTGVMTRPIWELMTDLPAFSNAASTDLKNAKIYRDRIVNLPSSYRPGV